jgi:hypothetical protein
MRMRMGIKAMCLMATVIMGSSVCQGQEDISTIVEGEINM